MTFYCGIDLHSTNNYLGIYDDQDRPVLSKKLPNDLGIVLKCHGEEYVEGGITAYEEKYRARVVKNLKRRAQSLGFELMPIAPPVAPPA
jgi:hypothetical protein